MDAWVPNVSAHSQASGRKKSKIKQADSDASRQHVVLEPGSRPPVLLREVNKRLAWSSFLSPSPGERLRSVKGNDPHLLFPPTRPVAPSTSGLSLRQSAERQAHALRTFYPDVDIPSDFMRDQVTADARSTEVLETFDPFAGNMMDVLYHAGVGQGTGLLAFPMGKTNADLNLSLIMVSKTGRVTFKPNTRVVQHFNTPIRNLSVAQSSTDSKGLVVRTMSSAHVFQVGRTAELKELASFSRANIGDRFAADVDADLTAGSATVVNDVGEVYRGQLGQPLQSVRNFGKDSPLEGDRFHRLARSRIGDNTFVLSADSLVNIDFRTGDVGPNLFSLDQRKDVFTSMACSTHTGDHLVRLTTTSDIIWLDERYAVKPVLSYKHGRNYDRSLQASIVHTGAAPLTILHSRKNSLLSIYDVSQSGTDLIRERALPYTLSTTTRHETHYGFHFLDHPFGSQSDASHVLQLSERGAISQVTLSHKRVSSGDEDEAVHAVTVQWSDDVKELEIRAGSTGAVESSMSKRSHHVVDFRREYDERFMPLTSEEGPSADEVADTLERMPYVWQHFDEPPDGMMTIADIALRSSDVERDATRADFLAQSALSGLRGYRAVEQQRLPTADLAQRAPWHTSIAPFLHRYVPDIPDDGGLPNVAKYDLKEDDFRSGTSIRRERTAAQQLALDLALSSHVYAPHAFSTAEKATAPPSVSASLEDDIDAMSQAASVMKLADDDPAAQVPDVHFGFLKPTLSNELPRKKRKGGSQSADDNDDNDEGEHEIPLGVRLLLSEWDVGTDPEAYEYFEPYGVDEENPRPLRTRQPTQTTSQAPTQTQTQRSTQVQSQRVPPVVAASQRPPTVVATSQRPPTIMPSSQPPAIHRAVPPTTQRPGPSFLGKAPSLGAFSFSRTQEQSQGESSQASQIVPSTQVMPGPFGGRPGGRVGLGGAGGTKKPAKKRKGGF
ncbi:hypothetical protein PENSPDRAFT_750563 [Peniophora sp. CONT]|nr:hypothetical protein PENSPDRAFT_750563 [Peniophora sp. CONT]